MAKKPEEESLLDAVRYLKHRDPFTPFRIAMISGQVFTIENPDSLAMNDYQLVYCQPRTNCVIYMRLAEVVTVDDLGEKPTRRKKVG